MTRGTRAPLRALQRLRKRRRPLRAHALAIHRDHAAMAIQTAGGAAGFVGAVAVIAPARHYAIWPPALLAVYLGAVVVWLFGAGAAWALGVARADIAATRSRQSGTLTPET